MFRGIASKVNERQDNEIRLISGQRYIPVRCFDSESSYHTEARFGVTNKTYSQVKFEDDFNAAKGGFQFTFEDTDLRHRFNWRNIVHNPLTFMFLDHCYLQLVPSIRYLRDAVIRQHCIIDSSTTQQIYWRCKQLLGAVQFVRALETDGR